MDDRAKGLRNLGWLDVANRPHVRDSAIIIADRLNKRIGLAHDVHVRPLLGQVAYHLLGRKNRHLTRRQAGDLAKPRQHHVVQALVVHFGLNAAFPTLLPVHEIATAIDRDNRDIRPRDMAAILQHLSTGQDILAHPLALAGLLGNLPPVAAIPRQIAFLQIRGPQALFLFADAMRQDVEGFLCLFDFVVFRHRHSIGPEPILHPPRC